MQHVVTADFDGDGVQDIAAGSVPQAIGGEVVVLLGRGDGTFAPKSSVALLPSPAFLVVGRFNADDLPDIVVIQVALQGLTILVNTTK